MISINENNKTRFYPWLLNGVEGKIFFKNGQQMLQLVKKIFRKILTLYFKFYVNKKDKFFTKW